MATGGDGREVKVVLLGATGVGKSSLVLRFVTNSFDKHSESTIGASFMSKVISVDDKPMKFQIWDTAGQEKYHSLAPMYYRGAAAAIIVYDITRADSFETLQRWVKELNQLGPENIVVTLAGNKSDLEDSREVSTAEAQSYAQKIGALFLETSAKTNTNVHDLFVDISTRLPPPADPGFGELADLHEPSSSSSGKKSKGCC